MSGSWISFVSLITPAVTGFMLSSIAVLLKKVGVKTEATLSLGFINVGRIPVKNIWIVRAILFAMSIVLLTSYSFKDYASLFPSRLDMDVYYDDEGITHILTEYNDREISQLRLSTDWKKLKGEFLRQVDATIEAAIGKGKGIFFEKSQKGWVHSFGYMITNVHPTKEWQVYFLKDVSGHLTHRLERTGVTPLEFRSEFRLIDTEENYVRTSLYDIYLGHTKILKPVFKQALSTPESDIFQFVVIGVSKIRFFPVPTVGRTLYCVRSDSEELVPIAYAIYRPY